MAFTQFKYNVMLATNRQSSKLNLSQTVSRLTYCQQTQFLSWSLSILNSLTDVNTGKFANICFFRLKRFLVDVFDFMEQVSFRSTNK